MDELKVALFDEPNVGDIVTIDDVEEVTVMTKDGERDALKVSFKDTEDGVNRSVTLWLSDSASVRSKLGAFAHALGKKPKSWIGKTIQFIAWSNADRDIVEVTD